MGSLLASILAAVFLFVLRDRDGLARWLALFFLLDTCSPLRSAHSCRWLHRWQHVALLVAQARGSVTMSRYVGSD